MTRWDRKMKTFQESPSPQRWPTKRKVVIPCSVFTLERQTWQEQCDFDLYEEADLPFLDKRTDMGREVAQKVIQSSLDDDVMSDDDTLRCATSILHKELSKAINSYESAFNKAALVRNLE